MKKLTKRKALTICKELWEWMAENPEAAKFEWPGWAEYGPMLQDCPCCEYGTDKEFVTYCRARCIMKWKNHACGYGEFGDWVNAEPGDKPKAALAIVKLCDEALTRLPKLKKKK